MKLPLSLAVQRKRMGDASIARDASFCRSIRGNEPSTKIGANFSAALVVLDSQRGCGHLPDDSVRGWEPHRKKAGALTVCRVGSATRPRRSLWQILWFRHRTLRSGNYARRDVTRPPRSFSLVAPALSPGLFLIQQQSQYYEMIYC